MRSIERRLKAIEVKSGTAGPTVAAIIRSFVRPGLDGPEDSGAAFATILTGSNKGLQLTRIEDETKEAFLQRVETTTGVS